MKKVKKTKEELATMNYGINGRKKFGIWLRND